jgi:hypothetical protein
MSLLDLYFPFDTGPGAQANPNNWRMMARLFSNSGVIRGYLGSLACSQAGSVVTVQQGAAWIDGFYGESDGTKTVAVSGNGMVVARMDPTARTITFVFVPSQTVPTQSLTGIFEVPLWQVTGTTGRDIRAYSNPPAAAPVHTRVCRVNPYSTSTTLTLYGFDSTTYGSGYSGGLYTCPVAADYLVMAQVGFNSSAANQWVNSHLYHNGVLYTTAGSFASYGPNWVYSRITDIVPCNQNDTLGLYHNCAVTGLQGVYGADRAYMTIRALV